jgi:hypothetical protein
MLIGFGTLSSEQKQQLSTHLNSRCKHAGPTYVQLLVEADWRREGETLLSYPRDHKLRGITLALDSLLMTMFPLGQERFARR